MTFFSKFFVHKDWLSLEDQARYDELTERMTELVRRKDQLQKLRKALRQRALRNKYDARLSVARTATKLEAQPLPDPESHSPQ